LNGDVKNYLQSKIIVNFLSCFIPNVIMTVDEKNIIRIWQETSETEELNFFITYAKKEENLSSIYWLNKMDEVW
jgi:hypothetical protein